MCSSPIWVVSFLRKSVAQCYSTYFAQKVPAQPLAVAVGWLWKGEVIDRLWCLPLTHCQKFLPMAPGQASSTCSRESIGRYGRRRDKQWPRESSVSSGYASPLVNSPHNKKSITGTLVAVSSTGPLTFQHSQEISHHDA